MEEEKQRKNEGGKKGERAGGRKEGMNTRSR